MGELRTSVFLCVNVSARACAPERGLISSAWVCFGVGGGYLASKDRDWDLGNCLAVSVQIFPANFPMASVWGQRSSLTLMNIIF